MPPSTKSSSVLLFARPLMHQTGSGSSSNVPVRFRDPATDATGRWVVLEAGHYTTCGVRSSGEAYCVGLGVSTRFPTY